MKLLDIRLFTEDQKQFILENIKREEECNKQLKIQIDKNYSQHTLEVGMETVLGIRKHFQQPDVPLHAWLDGFGSFQDGQSTAQCGSSLPE